MMGTETFILRIMTGLENAVTASPLPFAVFCAAAFLACAGAVVFAVKSEKALRRERHMRHICAQALQCQPDGFYLWLYDDIGFLSQTVCSSRLAVMFNLFDGKDAGFESVLERLTPTTADRLTAAVKAMRTEQTPFTLDVFSSDETQRWTVHGFQAQTVKDKPLLDIVWFRDTTNIAHEMATLSESLLVLREQKALLSDIFDAFPFPVWVRNEDLRITMNNPAYAKAAGSPETAQNAETEELSYEKSPREARILAAAARACGHEHTAREQIVLNGKKRLADVSEIPLKQNGAFTGRTLGFLRDVTAYGEMEETLKNHIAAHNGVLEHLKTAIAVFAPDMRLTFYNVAFLKLWDLDAEWLDSSPTYARFIDTLRDKRKLPEHRDFNAYKKQELHYFTTLVSMREDTLHLPNGLTLLRTMIPHPLGGLLIIYENVTDHLAMERSMNVLTSTQRALIDKMQEAVLVFSNTSRVRFVNSAYAELWNVDVATIESEAPTVPEMLEKQRPFFEKATDWISLKEQLLGAVTAQSGETFQLMRPDGVVLEFTVSAMPDGGILVSYMDITQRERFAASLQEKNDALLRKLTENGETGKRRAAFFNRLFGGLSPLLDRLDETAGRVGNDDGLRAAVSALKAKVAASSALCALQDDAARVPQLDSVDLTAFAEGMKASFADVFSKKELSFSIDCPDKTLFCVTDIGRLRMVFAYLLHTVSARAANRTKIVLKMEKNDGKGVLFTLSCSPAPDASAPDDDAERRFLSDFLAAQNGMIAFSRTENEEKTTLLLSAAR